MPRISERKETHKVIRSMKGLHSKKEVCIMELNVVHNIIITGSNDNHIHIWDY